MTFYTDKNNKANQNYTPPASVKQETYTEWVSIPVDGVWRYRCGNINCCRIMPFGVDYREFNYCPYCGAKIRK